MPTIELLLGRHGPSDHYLGGRYRPPNRTWWRYPRLAFPLSANTVHLFERITPRQRREPVAAPRLFPSFTTRYERTALDFATRVEAAGGRSYNAESRCSAGQDERYAELDLAAQRADLAFFARPTYAAYLSAVEVESQFGALREELIEANVGHFAAAGHDVIVRLGRIHSRVQRLARRGFDLRVRNGPGSFFPEQVLKRKALFDCEVREEDRMRGYLDRLLRIVPNWETGRRIPANRYLLSLAGRELVAACERFEATVRSTRALPHLRELTAILVDVAGYRPAEDCADGDPRFHRPGAMA